MREEIRKPIIEIIILMIISIMLLILSIPKAKALETICIQAQWLSGDYEPNTPVGTITYTYGRWLNACGSYAKLQIPVKVQAITTNPNFAMGLNSTIWRIELTNGETYYGKLENGYIEFYIRTDGVNHNEQLAVKNLYWEGYQPGEYKILISKYIQAYKLETDNSKIESDLNDIKNTDISEQDKQQPNQDEYNNYQQQEQELFDIVEQADTSQINIAMDIPTTTWVWNTMTTFLQTHALVFSMVISIISIGIIKHALGR